MRIEDVKSILAWEKHRIEKNNITEIMEVHSNSSNDDFLDRYKINEKDS